MVGVGQAGALSRAVDISSVGIFAAAGGYSALVATGLPAAAVVAAVAGFAGARLAMSRIDDAAVWPLPAFAPASFDPAAADDVPELLLTELAELLLTDRVPNGEELLLDDRLEQPAAQSRVIRLFDPRTLPTAGELHQRFGGRVGRRGVVAYADATAELHRALADLRRTMR